MSAIASAIVVSAAVGAYGAKKGAKAQVKATEQASDVQRQIFERQTELAEPFRQAGITSQNELMRLLGIGGDATAADYGTLTRGFRPEDLTMDPGYAFRLAEGEKALARMQSARGQYLGGGAIRAGTRYGQEMGSQEYMNAFNRAQTQLNTRLSALGSLYGAGQAAAGQVSGAAGQYGANVANLLTAGGAARASGYAGMANALNQALGTGLNYYQGQQWMKALYPQTPPTTPPG